MTVTIGSFSTNRLTAQPFGYEGEARAGLTARTFRVSGLLTPAEWQTLVSEYNSWRSSRINDQDTLLSNSVGTTVSLTISSTNGLSVTGLACWFGDAPSSEQVGAYVSASFVLVDAAHALAVLLAERTKQKQRQLAEAQEAVDCALISANLTRQRDETDCELTALQAGLADDFAVQNASRQIIDKTAELATYSTYGDDIASLDIQLETAQTQAKVNAAAQLGALKDVQAQLQIADTLAQNTAQLANASDLKAAQSVSSLISKYLSEDLPNLGSMLGITLTAPAETRYGGVNLQFTAAGNPMLTGPTTPLTAYSIQGYTTPAGASALLAAFDAGFSSGAGMVPTSPPSFNAEKVIDSGGVVSTRITVDASFVLL